VTNLRNNNNHYDESDIQVLEGLEAVRKRPGMYIGTTSARGLHHLVYEIVDNSIDEALAGFCDEINVVIHEDSSISVADNGRGIPVGINPKYGIPAVEIVFTMLHAGGKFGGGGYKVSGGLHGVGASVVNALSEWMIVKVRTEGKEYQMKFQRGETVSPLEEIGEADNTGSYIHFKPDSQIFEEINFNYDVLKNRLREMAFLNKGLKITLEDRREEKQHDEFCYEGGIVSFVEYLNRNRTALHSKPIYIAGEKEDAELEVALQYNESYVENIFSFANNISTPEGGSHLVGFKSGLTRVINEYARKSRDLAETSHMPVFRFSSICF
jgi:DNA gyrase subunit B